jgi:hypothetical protein
MAEYRLHDSFEGVGAFWERGKENEFLSGTLNISKGRGYLDPSPSARQLHVEDIDNFIAAANFRRSETIPCLNGLINADKVTLFDLVEWNGRGIIDTENKITIEADRWNVGCVLRGLHLASLKDESVDKAAFFYSKVSNLVSNPWTFQIGDNITCSAVREPVQVFSIRSEKTNVQIVADMFPTVSSSKQKKTLGLKLRVKVIPDHRQSVEWFAQIADRIENFFTLLMGTSVNLKRFSLQVGEDEGWLIRRHRITKQKIKHELWIKCSFDEMGRALHKWLDVPEDDRPIEKTLLGMMRRTRMYTETEFLSLAQALEGFGRERFPGKVNFQTRIRKTYNLIPAQFAQAVFGEVDSFERQIVKTRNFYTHLGTSETTDVIEGGKTMFLFNQRLHAFLRCVMLVDLAFQESSWQEAIKYQSTRWS